MNGRQLGALQKGDLNVSYSYNSDGLRVSKTVNGVKTEYVWDGSSLIGQKTGNNVLVYLYAADGLAGFQYNGVNYYYLFNGQGDVVGILNSSGTLVAKYTYDAWGKLLSVTDAAGNDKSADASFIGNINPVRYRSYYYDTETGLYYLQSRYYDPEVGRWINGDTVIDNASIVGTNVFTYCWNNPISYCDTTGCSPEALAMIKLGEELYASDNFILRSVGIGVKVCGKTLLAVEEKEYKKFLDGISQFESSNAGNYQAVNPSTGALGRYQVLPSVLHSYEGFENVTNEQFLNDPDMQDRFIQLYHTENWRIIQSIGLDKKVGSTFNGATITKAGLLAAAGFGAGNVQATFSGASTAYKGGITERLHYFAGYNIAYITGY